MRASEFLPEVNMDGQKGIGAVPLNADVDYFGLRVLVKPSTFLWLARSLRVDSATQERIDKMAEYIKGGSPVGQPWYNVRVPPEWEDGDFTNPAQITGHEGRHRMEAIQQAEGDAPVEVHLFFPGGVRARHITPEWVARLNKSIITEYGILYTGPWFKEMQLNEGGWDTTLTQGTVLHPRIVAPVLKQIDHFVVDFNRWLAAQNLPQVKRGRPTGSSSYHEVDAAERPDTVYGDIDLQMIAPDIEGKSPAQFAAYWNQLSDQFIKTSGIDYIADEGTPGHPIVQIGPDQYVQIDFMWHPESTSQWGAARVTPERGIKGLLFGNMFSVFGELLDLSIQHAGVQLKVIDGQHVPFSKQKGTSLVTVTINPETFILDTFRYMAKQQGINKPKIDPLLAKFPGNDINNVKIANLVQGVKGFARSAEANDMFGHGDLASYSTADEFLRNFIARYTQKAMIDVEGKKRDKATTPEAQARAEADRTKILQGLELVKGMFAQ